jgi:hypothetical protein
MGAKDPASPAAQRQPRRVWDASLAALAAALLFIPLPLEISPGGRWLPTAIVACLLVPLTLAQEAYRRPGGWEPSPRLLRTLSLAVLATLALAEVLALASLIRHLSTIKQGGQLLLDAALIWTVNVLVFALSYWELDGGGPTQRGHGTFKPHAFLFPQQTQEGLNAGWTPWFLDYLFQAFNTTTAFSPTDTMTLSRSAKALMMVQSIISLLTAVLVVARGVNIIGSR